MIQQLIAQNYFPQQALHAIFRTYRKVCASLWKTEGNKRRKKKHFPHHKLPRNIDRWETRASNSKPLKWKND
ncbi:CLUMA_CG011638, isoform A [Clunio marinus]|uniref:CLUMA_CG011638, isoform A n=1 Tax=Clunio marinus TaxID=568069 RepID=A0A1J1IFE7_9DIPT|nr:CLUMA_CG011638, isoform A [Clunio marinus]